MGIRLEKRSGRVHWGVGARGLSVSVGGRGGRVGVRGIRPGSGPGCGVVLLATGIVTAIFVVVALVRVVIDFATAHPGATIALGVLAVLMIVLLLALRRSLESARTEQEWNALVERLGADAATRVWRRELWIGAAEPVLDELFGPPADREHIVGRNKRTMILRYFPTDSRSYGLRITLEDGTVASWDDRVGAIASSG